MLKTQHGYLDQNYCCIYISQLKCVTLYENIQLDQCLCKLCPIICLEKRSRADGMSIPETMSLGEMVWSWVSTLLTLQPCNIPKNSSAREESIQVSTGKGNRDKDQEEPICLCRVMSPMALPCCVCRLHCQVNGEPYAISRVLLRKGEDILDQ